MAGIGGNDNYRSSIRVVLGVELLSWLTLMYDFIKPGPFD